VTEAERMAEYAQQIKNASDEVALLYVKELWDWGFTEGMTEAAVRIVAMAKGLGGLK